jgi:hypothetical protein
MLRDRRYPKTQPRRQEAAHDLAPNGGFKKCPKS